MALEVAVKAAVGAPDVLGDCMLAFSLSFSLSLHFLGFDRIFA